ncbi:hypothetical protein AXE85_05595 [Gemella sp. oral taxon 928]|uniref:phage tail family protein n=1 Tax=Gemella sp. oral taxon 928 TaxID=1785995 RepID=UPI00076828BB|nr:phage tail family protein [Gemella sp. oral taxon 928]AME09659.1 hypothetical protein AXE85_05595 [Gemella sp. oral taxon 928]
MISKYITYNGLNTKNLGLRLVDDIEFESPSNSMEFIEIDGVNGSKIKDKKRLSVVNRNFPFKVHNPKADIHHIINELNKYLINTKVGWHDFECSWDGKHLYKASFYETFKIEGSLNSRKKCVLNFKLHPVKYLKSGLEKITLSNDQILINPENREAKPLIKLRGTGDVTLTINTQIFKLRGVSGHIIIDCETQSAHWDNKEPQYDKVHSYPFPHLEPGDNRIKWDNNSFIVEITPRWEAVI